MQLRCIASGFVNLLQLDETKSLATQCTQAAGLVQVNIQIKNGIRPTINIMDILRASDNNPGNDHCYKNVCVRTR